jgi:hypothetical protein
MLALPTACISLNPFFKSSSPFMTVNLTSLFLAKFSAIDSKYSGTPSISPLPFAHYLDLFFV